MELHNIIEDMVIPMVEEIFDSIEKAGNTKKYCTCRQCRIDTACYVLNRVHPYYLISNRGAARIHLEPIVWQQKEADITTLIYEGLDRVNHNLRPNARHSASDTRDNLSAKPVFNIPTITGRLLDGNNFGPISGAKIELFCNGAAVTMKDENWQNPLNLEYHTMGTFSFWPAPVQAEKAGEHVSFKFTLQAKAPGLEPLTHIFTIPTISEIETSKSFSLGRVYKLSDLFMFLPGEAEKNLYLD